MEFDAFAKYFFSLLDYYTIAAVVMTTWTFSAWMFSWLCPQKHISLWFGAHFIWAFTGRDEGRRRPVLLSEFLPTLGFGLIPCVNVLALAFLLFLNFIFFLKAAFFYRELFD